MRGRSLGQPLVFLAPAVALAAGVALSTPRAARGALDDRSWLGAYTEAAGDLVPAATPDSSGNVPPETDSFAGFDLRGATTGVRVTHVISDSPADSSGVRPGDVILGVAGIPFTCPPDSARAVFRAAQTPLRPGDLLPILVLRDALERQVVTGDGPANPEAVESFFHRPAPKLESLAPGDSVVARAVRVREVIEIPVRLGRRPSARWPAPPSDDTLAGAARFPESSFTPLVRRLIDENGLGADTDDLWMRLARCHSGCDPWRLVPFVLAHRQPFRAEAVARDVSDRLADVDASPAWVELAADLLRPVATVVAEARAVSVAPLPREPRRGDDPTGFLEELAEIVTATLAEAATHHARAFAHLTEEEREFLEQERWNLSEAFAGEVYVHFDEDRGRFAKNARLIDLGAKVDLEALAASAAVAARLTDPTWAREVAARMARVVDPATIGGEPLLERETPQGRLVIAGPGADWHRRDDVAFLFDLGGDDFYTGNPGASNGWAVPVAIAIDIRGDDAYEATTKPTQGSGSLGVGGLLDCEGDDRYVALQWGQGTGYFGFGWLHDVAGDDVYRVRTFGQGVGLFGAGLVLDASGNDRWEGDCHVQAAGLARGVGALLDSRGDDEFWAKGLYPTGYGTAGIFDAWSQGCGMGFRTRASGGMGVLVDGGGRDRMEAGNFSQGGGYYYGFGILDARGDDSDEYVGSRYDQGFSAHQAVGVFREEGGDDRYSTRNGVAQGLAWDECVTVFIDEAGNDSYSGGRFFSQAASAHNSACFFVDLGGSDVYDYGPGPGRAGGNDYHGGTSLSFFLDAGGERDEFRTKDAFAGDGSATPGYGIAVDLDGSLERELRRLRR